MDINILEIAPIISDVRQTITFLRGRNLLLQDYWCCGQIASKVTDISLTDKEIFQCNQCKSRYSIRTNSFFSKSKLELSVLVTLLYLFSQCCTVTQCLKLLNRRISKASVVQWFNYFRDIMTTYFANNPVHFDNTTVHVEETFIGGYRKYNRGRNLPEPRWLFGINDKVNHKTYIQFVERKNCETIIPIIMQRVGHGCTIHSDGAKVYKRLRFLHYTHNSVIHERHYVDPITGIHTNWIENFWSNLKTKIKAIRGSSCEMLNGHLDEYIYRYNRKNEGPIFNLMLEDIANFYPI